MIKRLIATLIAGVLAGSAFAQTAPTAPTQATAPAITDQTTTRFAAGVTAALNSATTNIIYLEQTGLAPTISINQDGNSNRAGASVNGTTNSMILNGNNQVVTIDQTGNGNIINTLKVTGNNADVYLKQLGNTNTADVSCGLTTTCTGAAATAQTNGTNAQLDFRFTGNSNNLNYTGNGTGLQASAYVTGNSNTLRLQQTDNGGGQQMLINLTNSNSNIVDVLQTSSTMSTLVLTQTGTGSATFNISQTGTYSNAANITAVAAGGSFNIIQKSR